MNAALNEAMADAIATKVVERLKHHDLATSEEARAKVLAAQIVNEIRRHNQLVPEYLTPGQVAIISGFTEKALENFRSRRLGPPFLKVGRSVRYRQEDVRKWLELDTSDAAPENSDRRSKSSSAP